MVTIKTVNEADQALLVGFQQGDATAIRQLYDLVLPSVISWIRENKGSEADARDLFQEALLALYAKLEKGNFELTCRLKSFLRIICRNLWLNRLRNRQYQQATPLTDCDDVELDDSIEAQLERSEEQQLFFKHFDQLSEKCQDILNLFFKDLSMATIAAQLGFSEAYARKRKFQCKEKLIQQIKNDPIYRELQQAL